MDPVFRKGPSPRFNRDGLSKNDLLTLAVSSVLDPRMFNPAGGLNARARVPGGASQYPSFTMDQPDDGLRPLSDSGGFPGGGAARPVAGPAARAIGRPGDFHDADDGAGFGGALQTAAAAADGLTGHVNKARPERKKPEALAADHNGSHSMTVPREV